MGERPERIGPALIIPAYKSHLALLNTAEHAIAVELDFMKPVVAFGCLTGECGKLYINSPWHRRSANPFHARRNFNGLSGRAFLGCVLAHVGAACKWASAAFRY